MTFASLSVLDPTLIDGIRDQIADEFARHIFDAISDVGEGLEFEAEACASPTEKNAWNGRRSCSIRAAATCNRIRP